MVKLLWNFPNAAWRGSMLSLAARSSWTSLRALGFFGVLTVIVCSPVAGQGWTRSFSATTTLRILDIQSTDDLGFVLTGRSETVQTGYDMWVCKLNSVGRIDK